MTDILKPTDPRWDAFTDSLIYHLHSRINPDYPDHYFTDCDASFRITRNILATRYPEINIEKTLEYFKKNEWYCDCDVFFECPWGLGECPEEMKANV